MGSSSTGTDGGGGMRSVEGAGVTGRAEAAPPVIWFSILTVAAVRSAGETTSGVVRGPPPGAPGSVIAIYSYTTPVKIRYYHLRL